jgi:hypothetical protein
MVRCKYCTNISARIANVGAPHFVWRNSCWTVCSTVLTRRINSSFSRFVMCGSLFRMFHSWDVRVHVLDVERAESSILINRNVIFTSALPCISMSWCSIKYRENLTVFFLYIETAEISLINRPPPKFFWPFFQFDLQSVQVQWASRVDTYYIYSGT